MMRLFPLLLLVLLGTACTAKPEPVRTSGPLPVAEEPVVAPLEEEEKVDMLLGIQDRLRVYDVEEVSEVVDEALAGEVPTEEALIAAIEVYLDDRRQRLLQEVLETGAYTEEELSERLDRDLDERLFPVILAMEKKRLGLK